MKEVFVASYINKFKQLIAESPAYDSYEEAVEYIKDESNKRSSTVKIDKFYKLD